MNKINNWAKSFDTIFPVDKTLKKGYNEINIPRKSISVFDDAAANSALDYLYADANRNQTQSFLKNNGFPSAEERQLNKDLYGVQEEQKQMRDLLKSKTNGILNPRLPNDTDRAFLRGLMGDRDGELDYQNQLASANRAISDLQNAFRGTQFEDALNPTAQISSASPAIKHVSDGKLNATNQNGHVAILNSNNEDDIAQHSENKKFPSSITNGEYNNMGTMYAYSANNPVDKEKPSEPAPKAVRANVENAGGSVKWDSESNKATVKINGYTEEFYVGDGYGTFIQDGVMYTDDLHLNNLIYAPTYSYAKTMYDDIEDDFGKFVLRTWFFGTGSEVKVSGERWNNYIKNNPYVKDEFLKQTEQSIRKGEKTFDTTISVALTQDGGGYTSGYELINGSNKHVGGFNMQGSIVPKGNGKYSVTIAYTFNDIIDPNKAFRTDRYYSAAADFLGVAGKDYILRISGTATFTYSAKEGIVYE